MIAAAHPGVFGPELIGKDPLRPPPPAEAAEPMAESKEAETEYTIDELAAVSRVPSRTIRFYQSAGALPRPQIRGRVAFYGPAHLERLKLVAELQDRGLRIKAICELVGKIDRGELDLNEWLGLEAQLVAPWSNDNPRVVTEEEIHELIGGKRPGVIGELLRLKLVKRQGESYLVRSPGLLQISMKLESAGIDLDTAAEGAAIIRRHAARTAKELAEHFFKAARRGLGRDASTDDVRAALETMRPLSQEALRLIFGQEMERVLREMLESGKTTRLSGNRRSKR